MGKCEVECSIDELEQRYGNRCSTCSLVCADELV